MNSKLKFHRATLVSALVSALVAASTGCDAAPPQAGTAKQSVPAVKTETVDESFEKADEWETISGTWIAETNGDRTVLKQSATDQPFPVALLKQPTFSERWSFRMLRC